MPERKRVEPTPPARVMSIHAHPDDQEFTIAGTLAKWARAGSEIVTVCLTSGEAGSNESTPAGSWRRRNRRRVPSGSSMTSGARGYEL